MALVDQSVPFSHTATGILGSQRNSMLENPLHQRSELAKSNYTCFNLPEGSFVYGNKNQKSGSAADSFTFPSSYDTLLSRKHADRPRDFVAMNRGAVHSGFVTATEQKEFRACNDIRKPVAPPVTESKSCSRRIPPTMVFGVGTRPSTPICNLVANKYQDEWLSNSMKAKTEKCEDRNPVHMPSIKQINDTRSSLMRAHIVPLEYRTQWQLEKFKRKAIPQVNTFRSQTARQSAYDYNSYDRIGRQGAHGLGIYQSAKF